MVNHTISSGSGIDGTVEWTENGVIYPNTIGDDDNFPVWEPRRLSPGNIHNTEDRGKGYGGDPGVHWDDSGIHSSGRGCNAGTILSISGDAPF
ncbi:MAG: hypothetical protein WCP36_01710 [Methanomicrobiales archaeon]